MKKIIFIAGATIIVCVMTMTSIFAGSPNEVGKQNVSASSEKAVTENIGQNYVDVNQDGICDNQEAAEKGQNYVDNDQDGICDNKVNNQCPGYGQNECQGQQNCQQIYVDDNQDGICDQYQNKTCTQDGAGRHLRYQKGR